MQYVINQGSISNIQVMELYNMMQNDK
jgi:hypothetical protein